MIIDFVGPCGCSLRGFYHALSFLFCLLVVFNGFGLALLSLLGEEETGGFSFKETMCSLFYSYCLNICFVRGSNAMSKNEFIFIC